MSRKLTTGTWTKAEAMLKECATYPVPQGGTTYGAMRRRQHAQGVLAEMPKVLADWRRLTHDGYRFSARCMRCGDVITPSERLELKALYGVYRAGDLS